MIVTEELQYSLYASQRELDGYRERYGVDMSQYFDKRGECTFILPTYADLETGQIYLGIKQLLEELLGYHRNGHHLYMYDDNVTRFSPKLEQAHPEGVKIREIIPSHAAKLLSDEEREVLSKEVRIRNPRTGKNVTVLDISAMSTICLMHDFGLRSDQLRVKSQIETAILMQKLNAQMNKESIALKFRAIFDVSNLTPEEEVCLYGKPKATIRPQKLFSEEVYKTFARLRGKDHDIKDGDRYKKNAPVMNDLKRLAYGYLSPTARKQLKHNTGSNVRLGNCLNQHALGITSFNVYKAAETAELYYERGEHDKFFSEYDQHIKQIAFQPLLDD
ncbi:hypothetical protein [Photobacterium lutimaris]|uniref:Uncharacterized protein n=1 Tax=Photobacterium lutimaris TaxID=388278 RepID=A0A2T3J4I8_9GAMM|nr:hypothetical protein [Photobacterium lutimaris]PSU36217.1 hypothetical protein C9I99_04240 [Photobacterium lutimaris]TDR74909.1 hypothetical protein DFP78_106240 [Photobacterium lutimaris]